MSRRPPPGRSPHAPTPHVLNPALLEPRPPRQTLTAEAYAEGVLAGDRAILSRAITLAESARPEDRRTSERVLARCLPHTGGAVRVGITGVPGVGKSTLVGALGTRLTGRGHRLAVLAVDPTSTRSRGSILGDRTRMGALAADPAAYVRPSPTSGALGGVARATREAILLCEAAGFDVVLVETVGVGQSEVDVHAMVDGFVLLAPAGAGDELQGIKRGVVEVADVVAVTKADGANRAAALRAQGQYRNALRLLGKRGRGEEEERRRKGEGAAFEWGVPALLTSAVTGEGLDGLWEAVEAYVAGARTSGHFEQNRRAQARHWMRRTVEARLREAFFASPDVQRLLTPTEADVEAGRLGASAAAARLLEAFFRDEGKGFGGMGVREYGGVGERREEGRKGGKEERKRGEEERKRGRGDEEAT